MRRCQVVTVESCPTGERSATQHGTSGGEESRGLIANSIIRGSDGHAWHDQPSSHQRSIDPMDQELAGRRVGWLKGHRVYDLSLARPARRVAQWQPHSAVLDLREAHTGTFRIQLVSCTSALCRSPCHEKRVHASAPDRAKAKAFVPPARMPARKRRVLARGAHPSSDPSFRRRRHGRPRGRSLPAALAPAGGRPLTHLRRPSCWLRGCLRSAPGCGMHFKRLSSQMGLKKLWSGLMHGGSRAPKRVH